MILKTLSASLATMLLLCGVAVADPTSSRHQAVDHVEMNNLLFCSASYHLWINVIAVDPAIPTLYKMEMRTRSSGLDRLILNTYSDLGHTTSEAEQVIQDYYHSLNTREDIEFNDWLEAVEQAQCKQITNQWAKFDVL